MDDEFEDGEFFLDDEEFEKNAHINKISKAYSDIFSIIESIAKTAKTDSDAGNAKNIASAIGRLSSKVSALVEISKFDKKIVGPTGVVFNVFGIEQSDDEEEDNSETMTEEELLNKIEDIVKNEKPVSFSQATNDYNLKLKSTNVEDDGMSHGGLDDVDW